MVVGEKEIRKACEVSSCEISVGLLNRSTLRIRIRKHKYRTTAKREQAV